MTADLKEKKAEVRERCCQDLRRCLETALAGARGGVVSVKLNRVLEVGHAHMWKRHYAWCLSRLLRRYKFSDGLYVLTRQQAEELLNNLDALCAELLRAERQEKKKEKPEQKEPELPRAVPVGYVDDGEKMPNVSFHLPRALLQALDEYAHERGLTRSDVIRMAIRQMLDKMRAAEEEAAEKEEPEYIVIA
jgi:hypothetical protein